MLNRVIPAASRRVYHGRLDPLPGGKLSRALVSIAATETVATRTSKTVASGGEAELSKQCSGCSSQHHQGVGARDELGRCALSKCKTQVMQGRLPVGGVLYLSPWQLPRRKASEMNRRKRVRARLRRLTWSCPWPGRHKLCFGIAASAASNRWPSPTGFGADSCGVRLLHPQLQALCCTSL